MWASLNHREMCKIIIHPMAKKGVVWNITFSVFRRRCLVCISSDDRAEVCFLEDTPERPSVVNASFQQQQEGLSQTLTIQPQTQTPSWEMHTSTSSEPIFRLRPVRGCYSILCKWDEGGKRGTCGSVPHGCFHFWNCSSKMGKPPISRFHAKKRNWAFRFRCKFHV